MSKGWDVKVGKVPKALSYNVLERLMPDARERQKFLDEYASHTQTGHGAPSFIPNKQDWRWFDSVIDVQSPSFAVALIESAKAENYNSDRYSDKDLEDHSVRSTFISFLKSRYASMSYLEKSGLRN